MPLTKEATESRIRMRELAQRSPLLCRRILNALQEALKESSRSSWSLSVKATFPHAWKSLLTAKGYEGRQSISKGELLYAVLPKIEPCKECGYVGPLMVRDSGQGLFCSKVCFDKSDITISRRKATTLKRFGSENVFGSEQFKAKVKRLYLKALGVDNPSKSKEVAQKKIDTTRRNYDVDHHMHSEAVRNRIVANNFKKFGVSNPMQVVGVQLKLKSSLLEKYGEDNALKVKQVREKAEETMRDRFGVSNYFERTLSPEEQKSRVASVRASCQRRYGVSWPTQYFGPDRYTNYARKTYKGRFGTVSELLGYEPQVIVALEAIHRVVSVRKPKGSVMYKDRFGKVRNYFPDLVVDTTSSRIVIEVKSCYTLLKEYECNMIKFKAAQLSCKRNGMKFLLAVYFPDLGVLWIERPHIALKGGAAALDRLKRRAF